jgi:lipopolysaccharide/colanic/teichoic acid biosynthesis glycosyltransferase/glycosyltransferase involved in cell wall biosynthesis
MRVTFVTQYFPPETGAAPARALHFARALMRAGHEVRVVTGLPNHPSGVIRPEYRSVRRRSEVIDGIAVERVWLYATPRKVPLTRLWNHASFAISALPVLLTGPAPDVVLASTPPLFHGISALLAARLRGATFVNDCRDDWPHAAIALGEMRPGAIASVLDQVARSFQRRATRILVVTPGMRRQLAARGFEERKLVLLPNGADTELFQPGPSPPAPSGAAAPGSRAPSGAEQEPFTVTYAGTHGLVHGMDALLEAAEVLRGEAVRFRFVGDGVAKAALEQHAAERGLSNCTFEPSVAPEQLVQVLHDSDACVATTRASEFAGETIPVKVFDYLACGCPVIAAVRGDAADVVTASGGGLVVAPEDGAAIAGAVRRLRDDPALRMRLGAAGPAFVEREHSRRALGERLVQVLEAARQEHRGRPIAPVPDGPAAWIKRAADIVLALAGLLVAAPVMLLVAIAIKLDSPGPVLFRQRRIGQGSREFILAKFRSMAVGTPDLATHLVDPRQVRVTNVGAFIRRTSLDELPQLWHVLTGDMTLVGPRPALYNQYDLIAMRQRVGVDAMQPGLTGWAQVNGRDEIPMERKVAYDREYLERHSLAFDARILFRTATTLFSMRGIK